MRFAISIVSLSLVFTSIAAAQNFDDDGERAMLDQINALRAEQSLAPLARMPELDAIARAHSAEMARNGALVHVSATTGTPEDRVHNAGIPASTITENVAAHRDTQLAFQ